MITRELIEAYWNLVAACIRDVHKKSDLEALSLVSELRQSLQSAQYDPITYHTEPYVVAWKLTKGEILTEPGQFYQHVEVYAVLVGKHLGFDTELKMPYGK